MRSAPIYTTWATRPQPRGTKWLCVIGSLLALAPGPAAATDGQPILDLGIVSWLEVKKRQLVSEVTQVKIADGAMQPRNITVSIYQAVIFEDQDEANHRLVFLPDIDNKMEGAYKSAAIGSKERWGAEFHGFGTFPYHCTIHPEEQGAISVKMYGN